MSWEHIISLCGIFLCLMDINDMSSHFVIDVHGYGACHCSSCGPSLLQHISQLAISEIITMLLYLGESLNKIPLQAYGLFTH